MESFIAAQNQLIPTPATPQQRTIIPEIVSTPVYVFPTSQPAQVMPARFPWGIPPNFMPEGYAPTVALMPASLLIMSMPSPFAYAMPRVEETIYHSESFEGPQMYEKMDEMKDQFQELKKELKTLRGKDLFGKNAAEFCLVPNVKIPVKFKVLGFDKYKWNTCLLSHIMMYARKISTQTDNGQFLIHYFQDSLADITRWWYMGLDIANVRTYNDLGDAFIK
ncbi:uncharacterized protein LOC127123806 [Lathyrus oleraceus]|uniref:uncharacterized protein LOC127123806 n=1 Tax=Pisum sativum TaxID=3888 RepID=UPI0021CF1B18|nr:uncharacterized protein LOC127123806 [Pisum sativum]